MRARASRAALAASATCLVAVTARADMMEVPPATIEIVDMRLDNGLHVIVAPDPNVASIAVHVRYDTGSADAPLIPLVERLMFAGSTHVADGDYDKRITAIGGWAGSVSTSDHLSVFELVPAEAYERVLWLEAERMAGLADGITDATVSRERAALPAQSALATAVDEALWGPRPHGEATRARVRDTVFAYIGPRDTTLVIAGNVDAGAAILRAKRYFGWLPRAPSLFERPAPKRVPLARAVEVERPDPIPKAIVAVRTNAPWAADTVALEVAARVLAGGRRSRMQRALVDTGLASEVHVDVVRQRMGGELRFVATAKPGRDPHELAAAMRAAIAELRDHGADETTVRAAATSLDAELVTSLENLAVRADAIAAWSIYTGNAQFLDNARTILGAVTADEVRRALGYWCADTALVTAVGR